MQVVFGSGILFAKGTGTNPTPVRFGVMQDVAMDHSFSLKELYGQYQYPVTVARGLGKITGKAKSAQITGAHLNNTFFGQTLATGATLIAQDEAGTVPGTPYTVTVTNAATFTADLGVYVASTGKWLTRVAGGAEVANTSYSVTETGGNKGKYVFAAGDTTVPMKFNYQYTTASGYNIAVTNQLIGQAATFSLAFMDTYNGQQFVVTYNAAISNKFAFGTKLEDFNISEFDLACYADSSNAIMTINTAE